MEKSATKWLKVEKSRWAEMVSSAGSSNLYLFCYCSKRIVDFQGNGLYFRFLYGRAKSWTALTVLR